MRALVLGGGAVKGAHTIGVIQHLLGDLQLDFQIITGVSVGAINAAFLSQFHTGEEKIAAQQIKELWLKLKTKDVYKRHFPFGIFHAIWKNSFYNSYPLYKLIKSNLSLDKIRSTGKQVAVGTISLNSGKYTIFNQNSDDFVDAVIASASFPSVFTPIKIGDQLWIDGGNKMISPVNTAIELGADDITVVVTSPEKRTPTFIKYPSVVDVIMRAIDLGTEKIMSNNLNEIILYNKLADAGIQGYKKIKLNIIRPKFNLVENFLLFEPEEIRRMIDLGYRDAVEQFKAK